MDLYSAARRLNRPFVFQSPGDGPALDIGGRGIIGDGFSAALIRPDGVIDWMCLPRFDSPSVFGAMLDAERGGSTGITPTRYPFEALQAYDPGTNVLETLFRVPGEGVVRVTDFMPFTNHPRAAIHEVHRRVQCVEGSVTLRVSFDPRFSYGRDLPDISVGTHGCQAEGREGERLSIVFGKPNFVWHKLGTGGAAGEITLRAGERHWCVLSWNAPAPEPIAAYRSYEHLRTTRHTWRAWAMGLKYDGPWRHHVQRSALLLKLLIYRPTGAMVAAPTMGLPELIGGGRNWDYRYTWSRDTAMGIRAANLLGFGEEAGDFFHFMRDVLSQNQSLRVMYTIDGAHVPSEEDLTHLRGFRESIPVRLGNDARDQLQLDTAGALIDAAYLYERFGGSLTLRGWRHLHQVIESLGKNWDQPDHGIWEPRSGLQQNVHSKVMSWVAMDRGAYLARLFGAEASATRWTGLAGQIHRDACARGLSANGKHFVASYGLPHMDASLLLIPIHGFLPADDTRILATVREVRAQLGSGPYVHRYHNDDGLDGEEGAFVLCGFWLAEALAMAGQLDEAQEVFIAHAEASNHLGLLAEEIDPISKQPLGNFPQAFSHLGLINAAARIDSALRLADEGTRSKTHLSLLP